MTLIIVTLSRTIQMCHPVQRQYAIFFAECHYAEHHYAECHGVILELML
jgi:hypothetical protein